MKQNESSNNSNDRMQNANNPHSEQGNESLNTASGLRNEMREEQDGTGSGRSYDYGTEGSTEEDLNEQLGRNSNQQNVSNPINTPGAGGSPAGTGRSDSRAGSGSGLTTKQNITGSDFDGQNRE